jgi:hypothetical protein
VIVSLFALFVMLVWICAGAKSAPLIAKGVGPVVRPLVPPARVVARHVRLPLACMMAFGLFVAVGLALGIAYSTLLANQPRTCAQVETAIGPVVTCEIGHPYHNVIVESQKS